MRKTLGLILLILTAVGMVCVMPVKAQSTQTVTIHANGEISPPDVAIQRFGDIYTLTSNLNSPIVIEANNIILDGAGHTLQGPNMNLNSIGVNLTATNVTVQNIRITSWWVGFLGTWNNNTVSRNVFMSNDEAVAIFGDDYVVSQNSISNSSTAVFVDGGFREQGDNNIITLNQIAGNTQALDITKSNGTVVTTNNIADNNVILAYGQTTGTTILFFNNFTNNVQALTVPVFSPTWEGFVPISPAGQWDNGSVGNYWSDYTAKYLNASEIGNTNIGNIHYAITDTLDYQEQFDNGTVINKVALLGTATDNYPLMGPTYVPTTLLSTMPIASPVIPEFPMLVVPAILLLGVCIVAFLSVRTKLLGSS